MQERLLSYKGFAIYYCTVVYHFELFGSHGSRTFLNGAEIIGRLSRVTLALAGCDKEKKVVIQMD